MLSFFNMLWSWLKDWVRSLFSKDDPEEPDPAVIPAPEKPEPFPGEVVCYYGCPNSKKAEKLQLQKKLYR